MYFVFSPCLCCLHLSANAIYVHVTTGQIGICSQRLNPVFLFPSAVSQTNLNIFKMNHLPVEETIASALKIVIAFLTSHATIDTDVVKKALLGKDLDTLMTFLAKLSHTPSKKADTNQKKKRTKPVASDDEDEDESERKPAKKKKKSSSSAKDGKVDDAEPKSKKKKSRPADVGDQVLKMFETRDNTKCVEIFRQALLYQIVHARRKKSMKDSTKCKNLKPAEHAEVRKQTLEEVFAVPMSAENKAALVSKEKKELSVLNSGKKYNFASFKNLDNSAEHTKIFKAFLTDASNRLKKDIAEILKGLPNQKAKRADKGGEKKVDTGKPTDKKSGSKADSDAKIKETTALVVQTKKKKEVVQKPADVDDDVEVIESIRAVGKAKANADESKQEAVSPSAVASEEKKEAIWRECVIFPGFKFRLSCDDEDPSDIELQLSSDDGVSFKVVDLCTEGPLIFNGSRVSISLSCPKKNLQTIELIVKDVMERVFFFDNEYDCTAPYITDDGKCIAGTLYLNTETGNEECDRDFCKKARIMLDQIMPDGYCELDGVLDFEKGVFQIYSTYESKRRKLAEIDVRMKVCEEKAAPEKTDALDGKEGKDTWHTTTALPAKFFRFVPDEKKTIKLELRENANSELRELDILNKGHVRWEESAVGVKITRSNGNVKHFMFENPLERVFGFVFDEVNHVGPLASDDGKAIEGMFAPESMYPEVFGFFWKENASCMKPPEDLIHGRLDFSTGFFTLRRYTETGPSEELKSVQFEIFI
jgi:hypothetical protein